MFFGETYFYTIIFIILEQNNFWKSRLLQSWPTDQRIEEKIGWMKK